MRRDRPAGLRWPATPPRSGEPISGKHAAALRELWAKEKEVLDPLLRFQGVPYQDNESTGTVLNESGKQLERDVSAAIRSSRRVVQMIDNELTAIVTELQTGNARSATQLRFVMLVGLLIAVVLAGLVTVLLLARQRQDATLREARQQTTDILRTVKDGLFLLDEHLIIGASYSSALESLFQRSDFAGLHFEQLLKGIVSEKTLSTAVKFVGVLWSERTKENLVKSINPLGEVEVHFDSGQGKLSTRYLQFEFHRVRVEGKITHVLVSVADVSARVDLARELQASQSQAQAQVDTLLGILHVDPKHLASFLNDSNAAMKMINAVLREPAREETAFRKKLDTLFRQVHSVKGEAAALGLSSIETRAHSFEDDLKLLREKADLSGNDFLPLVIKLDDLLTHLQSVGDLVSRLAQLHGATNNEGSHTDTAVLEDGGAEIHAKPESGIPAMLQQLTARVAAENNKEAALQCMGFDTVPDGYRRIVKDIAVQAVRNAIVHGIELAGGAARRREIGPRRAQTDVPGSRRRRLQAGCRGRWAGLVHREDQGGGAEERLHYARKSGHAGRQAGVFAAVSTGIFHGRNRHQGCGPGRGDEHDGRSHAPDRRQGFRRHDARKIHAADAEHAGGEARRVDGSRLDGDPRRPQRHFEAHDRR